MDNLEMNIIKLQTYKMQHKIAQIQLENAELQHKLLKIQLQKESWQKAELESRIHEVLNDDEIVEMEKQYAKKEKNKEYLGYQPNGIKLDDSNPPKCDSDVPPIFKSRWATEPLTKKLPPIPKRPPKI